VGLDPKERTMENVDVVEIGPAAGPEAGEIVPAYEWLFAPPGARPPGWDPGRAEDALRSAISSEAAIVLVARLEGRLVGVCTAYVDLESVRFGRRVWVEDLMVHPAHRSLGIGKRLLDAAKVWARERGASHLELDSGEARADAHRFYEREAPSSRTVCFGWDL
jgi:GNAT superfamily N-acetyltransferase